MSANKKHCEVRSSQKRQQAQIRGLIYSADQEKPADPGKGLQSGVLPSLYLVFSQNGITRRRFCQFFQSLLYPHPPVLNVNKWAALLKMGKSSRSKTITGKYKSQTRCISLKEIRRDFLQFHPAHSLQTTSVSYFL